MPAEKKPIILHSLNYNDNIKTKVRLHFLNDNDYDLLSASGVLLSRGTLGKMCAWGNHTITIVQGSPCALRGKKFTLKLFPLHTTVYHLQKKIRVKKDPLQRTVSHLIYDDQEAEQAAAIVNTLLEEYRLYLQRLSAQKMQAHLEYLTLRKKQAEQTIIEQQNNLSKYIDTNTFSSFAAESEFINKQQTVYFAQATNLRRQIEQLDEFLSSQKRPFEEIMALVSDQNVRPIPILEERIIHYGTLIDQLDLNIAAYDQYREGKENTLPDNTHISPLMIKIHALERNLMDQDNFAEKEKKQLQEQLHLEKKALTKEIIALRENAYFTKNAFQEKVTALQKELLLALYNKYQEVQTQLTDLGGLAKKLPLKWLENAKVETTTSIETNVIKTLTQLVETNNLQDYTAPLAAIPIQSAIPPSLVNPPRLLLGFIAGGLLGAFGALFIIALIETAKGPSSSEEHLKKYGYSYLGRLSSSFTTSFAELKKRDQRVLLRFFGVIKDAKVIFCHQKEHSLLAEVLASYFAKEQLCFLDLDAKRKINKDMIPLGEDETFLMREEFSALIQELNERYDRLLIVSQKASNHPCYEKLMPLVDCAFIALDEERMQDISHLSCTKVHFFRQEKVLQKLMTSSTIRLFLEKWYANFLSEKQRV